MANTKLSDLTAVNGPIQATDEFYMLRAGASRRVVGAQMLLDLLSSTTEDGNTYRTLSERFNDVYNVMDFGAAGDGVSHPLSADEATAYNTAYGALGLTAAAGNERDRIAHMAMFLSAAVTGRTCYTPIGTYLIDAPMGLNWTATPITGQPNTPLVCRWHGDGRATVIRGVGIVAGRAVIEMFGESNTYAVNLEISHMQIEEATSCHKYSFCMRIGDGYCGINLHRVIFKGAQAVALRVGSSLSYAQICFQATQCQFWSNWNFGWGSDTGLDVYSVYNESLGSYWDSAHFQSCFFWGQCNPRAFTCKFETCMFIVPVERALNIGCVVYLGTCAWDNCYFEDHLIAIASVSLTALVPVTNIAIRNCHFSSVNNSGLPANAQSSIQCARDQAEHGPVTIESCRFGGTATYSDIDLYGPITVSVFRCCHPFAPINVGPDITTAGNVRLVAWNPNGENPYDYMDYTRVRPRAPDFEGPSTFHQDVNGGSTLTISNADVGNVATAAVVAKSGDVEGSLVAYHDAHPALASYIAIINSEANGAFAVAIGGPIRFEVDNTWVRATKTVDAGYGFAAQNAHAGTSAYTFVYGYNGAVFGGFHVYGPNHAFANVTDLGSFSPTYDARLVAGGSLVATLDAATLRMYLRDYGVVDGIWYTQTTTQAVHTSVAETPITTGGQGLLTVPAGMLQVGSVLELEVILTEEAIGVVTFTHRFYLGTNAVVAATVTTGGVLAVTPRCIRLKATIKTLGVTGTIDYVALGEGAAVQYGTATVDTTGALTFYASTQMTVSDAGNKVTCPQATFRAKI